jgi:hypothetical protein
LREAFLGSLIGMLAQEGHAHSLRLSSAPALRRPDWRKRSAT